MLLWSLYVLLKVELNKPLIASVNGVAVGGGATILLHFDSVFISPKIHPRALGVYFSANISGFGSDKKLGIIPLAHVQFCKILQIQSEILKDGKKIESKKMYRFYKDIHLKANSLNNKDDWEKEINTSVNNLVSEYTL